VEEWRDARKAKIYFEHDWRRVQTANFAAETFMELEDALTNRNLQGINGAKARGPNDILSHWFVGSSAHLESRPRQYVPVIGITNIIQIPNLITYKERVPLSGVIFIAGNG